MQLDVGTAVFYTEMGLQLHCPHFDLGITLFSEEPRQICMRTLSNPPGTQSGGLMLPPHRINLRASLISCFFLSYTSCCFVFIFVTLKTCICFSGILTICNWNYSISSAKTLNFLMMSKCQLTLGSDDLTCILWEAFAHTQSIPYLNYFTGTNPKWVVRSPQKPNTYKHSTDTWEDGPDATTSIIPFYGRCGAFVFSELLLSLSG